MKQAFAVAIHQHEHGSDGYLFAYEQDQIPAEEQIAQQLGIDYEPDKGEDLIVSHLVPPDMGANPVDFPSKVCCIKP